MALTISSEAPSYIKAPICFVTSVPLSIKPHVKSQEQLNGFSQNSLLEIFTKICRPTETLVKIRYK
jgi:hypothetical protein